MVQQNQNGGIQPRLVKANVVLSAILFPLVVTMVLGGFKFWHDASLRIESNHARIESNSAIQNKILERVELLREQERVHIEYADELVARLDSKFEKIGNRLANCSEKIIRLQEQLKYECQGRKRAAGNQ